MCSVDTRYTSTPHQGRIRGSTVFRYIGGGWCYLLLFSRAGCAIELQTKVPEDYTKSHNHGEGYYGFKPGDGPSNDCENRLIVCSSTCYCFPEQGVVRGDVSWQPAAAPVLGYSFPISGYVVWASSSSRHGDEIPHGITGLYFPG